VQQRAFEMQLDLGRPVQGREHPKVRMVLVGDSADAADDWIAERIGATDVCVTSDIPLASRCLKRGARVVSPTGTQWTGANIGNALAGGPQLRRHLGRGPLGRMAGGSRSAVPSFADG